MSQEAVPSTFVIERHYDATPARVFQAWADPAAKARWFSGPNDWQTDIRELDFRVGGRERVRGVWPDGRSSDFVCQYHDIVTNQRIVYAYDMHVNDVKISVSLATVEFAAERAGTRLRFTEQAVFIDGYDDAGGRETGSRWLLEKIDASLR